MTVAGRLFGDSFPAASTAVTANVNVPRSSSLADAESPLTRRATRSQLPDPLRRRRPPRDGVICRKPEAASRKPQAYSYLSAAIGSSRIARRAGTRHATRLVAASVAATTRNTVASHGWTS